MTPQSLRKYQDITNRIRNFQRSMYVRPLTPFQRAVLSVQYASR